MDKPSNSEPTVNHNFEVGEDKRFDFSEMSIQKAFLKKVYGILTCQLLITLGVIMIFVRVEPVKLWIRENPKFLLGAIIVTFLCVIIMACCDTMRRKAPMNFICLGIFTVAESIMLGFISSFHDTEVVMMAVGTTAAICVALTSYAFQTKWDFTVCGGLVICFLTGLLIFGNIAAFYGQPTSHHLLNTLYSVLGALLFSLIFIIDTQLMLAGAHKYTISPEEYIFAALNLYLDAVNIFLYILRCISGDCD